MSAWVWILIGVVVVSALAAAAWYAFASRRSQHLRGRFGPEYDRVLSRTDSKRDAEAELRGREERRGQLDIRPLSQATRARCLEMWQVVQAEFVDDPENATRSAESLTRNVMLERGYPMEDFEQRAADISVDHPAVVENYRNANRLTSGSSDDRDRTEDLRQAMRHYRALFDELVEPEPAADAPMAAESDADERVGATADRPSRASR